MGQKVDINLKNSLNTNTIAEDIRGFQDAAAPALQNTGIERDGGITNVYETKEDYAVAGDHFITEDGNVLQSVVSGDQRLISVDGRQIGIASAYGVGSRQAFQGADDSAISSTGTILTAAVKGSGIEVNEYSATGALLDTRVTTFTNLAAVLQFFTSLSIIRYQGIKFADQLEFALRLGPEVLILDEATPAQTIANTLQNTEILIHGNYAYCAVVMGRYLVIAGNGGYVASFDGVAWKYPDGTGGGTGPYTNDPSITGGGQVLSMCVFYTQASNTPYLITANSGGRIASWSMSTGWNAYTKAGAGLWNNAAVVSNDQINIVHYFINSAGVHTLAVGSNLGKMGSYTEAGGWVLYSAGAGLRDNATLLGGAVAIKSFMDILNAAADSCLLVGGASGRMGCMQYVAAVWTTRLYNIGYNGLYPTDNATLLGASEITLMAKWGANDVIVASAAAGCRVGMISAYVKYAYNGAGGPGVCINNSTALPGAVGISAMAVYNGTLAIISTKHYASWDGANWKNYDGTGIGTGIYGDKTVGNYLGTNGTIAALNYAANGTNLTVVVNYPSSAAVTSITTASEMLPFYDLRNNGYGVGSYYSPSLIPRGSPIGYLYGYKYENGAYLFGITGQTAPFAVFVNTINEYGIYDPATGIIYALYAKYAIPQVKSAKTRHILSSTPKYSATQLFSLSLCGYTDFVTFATAALFPDVPQALGSVLASALGFNYADITFKQAASAVNIFHYVSPHEASQLDLCRIYQSQTNTLANGYGKLTNGKDVAPSKPFEMRVGLLNGIMSFVSAAVLDGIGADAMGTLLTNVGEIDPNYTPDFQDDRILYRYNGQFFYVVLSKTLTGNVFQKISEKAYKVNTISPLNILSMIDQRLHVGSSDYHGQMIFESTAAPAAVATNVASVLAGAITADPLAENIYSNSIDVGNKLCYITAPTAANISLVGYRIPFGYQSIQEMISTYIADIYAFSTANDGSELVLTDPNNPAYLEDTRLPVAIGLAYNNGAVNNGQSTIFLKPDYDGYEIGNEAKGVYVAFQLFGTTYLFDGVTIFQANFSNGIYGGKIEIAPAVGMSFLAATPNQAYFLSPFDNSVYVFNGGRSLAKFQRLSQMPAVLRGIFSTRDNTLLLETATSFIWVRDEIVTQNLKSAAQTALKLYDTTLGLIIGNDSSRWRYGYSSLGGSSVVLPIIWQSSYYGQTSGQRSNLEQFFATIYSATKAAQIITAKVDAFDEKAHYAQTVTFPVKPSDYSSAGYYRFRMKPKTQKTLGTSLTLTIPAKAVLSDVYLEYSDDAAAVVTGNATR